MDKLLDTVMDARKKNFDAGNKDKKTGTLLDFLWKRKRMEENAYDDIERQERGAPAASAVRG